MASTLQILFLSLLALAIPALSAVAPLPSAAPTRWTEPIEVTIATHVMNTTGRCSSWELAYNTDNVSASCADWISVPNNKYGMMNSYHVETATSRPGYHCTKWHLDTNSVVSLDNTTTTHTLSPICMDQLTHGIPPQVVVRWRIRTHRRAYLLPFECIKFCPKTHNGGTEAEAQCCKMGHGWSGHTGWVQSTGWHSYRFAHVKLTDGHVCREWGFTTSNYTSGVTHQEKNWDWQDITPFCKDVITSVVEAGTGRVVENDGWDNGFVNQ